MNTSPHSPQKLPLSGITDVRHSRAERIIFLSLLWFIMLPCIAHGAERQHSSFEVGGIYVRQANNFSTNSKARINNLNTRAPSESTTRPFALIHLSTGYGKNNRLYLRTDPEQMDDLNIYLGTHIPLSDKGNRLDIAVFTSPLFSEVWKNPYATGSAREETDVIGYGIRIALNDVLCRSLNVSLKAAVVDVDDDEIGGMYRNLRRDGRVYTVTGEYRFSLTSNLSMTPSLNLDRGDFKGESNSFYRYGMALKWMYAKGDMTFIPMIRYSFATYDENHPIFDKRREDHRYLAALMITFSNPFGLQDFFIRTIGGYGLTESNITFCDATGKFVGLTMGYRF